MSQNIYDNPDFFAGYATLPRSAEGLDGAPEWTAMQTLPPPLAGKSVIDRGAGMVGSAAGQKSRALPG